MKSTRSTVAPSPSNSENTPSRSAASTAASTSSESETTARCPAPSASPSSSTVEPSLSPGHAAPGPCGAKRSVYPPRSTSSSEVFASSTNAAASSAISLMVSGVTGTGHGSGNVYGAYTSPGPALSGGGGPQRSPFLRDGVAQPQSANSPTPSGMRANAWCSSNAGTSRCSSSTRSGRSNVKRSPSDEILNGR